MAGVSCYPPMSGKRQLNPSIGGTAERQQLGIAAFGNPHPTESRIENRDGAGSPTIARGIGRNEKPRPSRRGFFVSFQTGNCQGNFGTNQPRNRMDKVEFGRRLYLVPSAWNELSREQLLRITRLHGQKFASDQALDDAFRSVLLGKGARLWARLNAVQRVELRRLVPVRFLREPQDYAPLTEQLQPYLPYLKWWQGLGAQLFGPRSNFRNLSFAEFIFADAYFLRYLQTNDRTQLDRLVATLYRPTRAGYAPHSPSYGGDRREDFNENLLDDRTRQVAKLEYHVKYAVLLWYRGCRKALESRFEYVFSGENNAKGAAGGWADVLHELAGGVVNIDTTAGQLLPTVLREMNRVLRQAEQRAEALRPNH